MAWMLGRLEVSDCILELSFVGLRKDTYSRIAFLWTRALRISII